MRDVYLDYNASAPLDERVTEVMVPVLSGGVGNASSVHHFGRLQAALVDEAREHVAELVGGRPSGVVFTAGATEANNLALRGVVEAETTGPARPRILVSAVEHASVARTARWLADRASAKLALRVCGRSGVFRLGMNADTTLHPLMTRSVKHALIQSGCHPWIP